MWCGRKEYGFIVCEKVKNEFNPVNWEQSVEIPFRYECSLLSVQNPGELLQNRILETDNQEVLK